MADFSVRVVGSTAVANNMRTRAAHAENTYPVTYKWAQGVRGKLKGKAYPPRLPHFTHTRTGGLANGWAVVSAGRNAVAIVNNANRGGFPYPILAIGNSQGQRVGGRGQHPSFTRWWLARPLIDEERPQLKKDITRYVVDV